jgi:phosphate transport system permease protein
MRRRIRQLLDRLFTASAGLSVLLLTAALLVVLGPIFYTGSKAVVFRGTVEWRKVLLYSPKFGRGDPEQVQREVRQTNAARQEVYDILRRFSRGIDVRSEMDKATRIRREVEIQLQNQLEAKQITEARAEDLTSAAERIAYYLTSALETTDNDEAMEYLERVLGYRDREALSATVGEEFFELAASYKKVVAEVDLSRRERFGVRSEDDPQRHEHGLLGALKEDLRKLFGSPPGAPPASLEREQYGVSHWQQALRVREQILYIERRELNPETGWMDKIVRVRRAELFDGELDGLFDALGDNEKFTRMMKPRWTFYWRYFIDQATPLRVYGGVGPEILGTLSLTVMAILFAVPIGVTTAGFLVECTSDHLLVRFLRMCINTLAGVPSIVFGLFGMAFFVLWFQPAMGMGSHKTVLAGALTLGVLVLPIVIRASEEAIRAVPPSYKEASLALGAGQFRTFVTVTLPAALPGVLTGVILSMSRAAGETAPILFTAAVTGGDPIGGVSDLFSQGTRALPYAAYDMAMENRLAGQVPHNQYGMTMTLILLVLLLNVVAIIVRQRMARKLRGQ